jgi:hypothetical protein
MASSPQSDLYSIVSRKVSNPAKPVDVSSCMFATDGDVECGLAIPDARKGFAFEKPAFFWTAGAEVAPCSWVNATTSARMAQ